MSKPIRRAAGHRCPCSIRCARTASGPTTERPHSTRRNRPRSRRRPHLCGGTTRRVLEDAGMDRGRTGAESGADPAPRVDRSPRQEPRFDVHAATHHAATDASSNVTWDEQRPAASNNERRRSSSAEESVSKRIVLLEHQCGESREMGDPLDLDREPIRRQFLDGACDERNAEYVSC